MAPPASAQTTGLIAQIELDGPIGPAAAEYFDQASSRAAADGAVAIVLQLDTPGGLADSMRQIITTILASKVPVLGYVAPGGARAASAGTYILYACHIAAMAPATHLGAATPVSLGGPTSLPSPPLGDKSDQSKKSDKSDKPDGSDKPEKSGKTDKAAPVDSSDNDAEARKVLNDAIAYIRSLAQLRGRNVEWAEAAVRGAETLTADEALEKHVIDFVAGDVPAVLAQANGREVHIAERAVTLQLKGLPISEYTPNGRARFLMIVTNPLIAYLLLLAGVYGIALEAFHPGTWLPGIVGSICLLIGLYALQLLPVNYAGLALMALGIGLLVTEFFVPTVGALGVGGIIAFVFGSILLFNTGVPGYAINLGVIAGIATCAALLLALMLWLVMRSRSAPRVSGEEYMLGASGELLAAVSAGGETWARVHGERWRVNSAVSLPEGARVRVVRRQGLLLWVVPE
ncbi:MAG TPA: nodulation protein NfeD [Rudaea sp.]|nr:nodulation protein NfeD [Rudaea sp.]